jgi:hypothetical protein
MAAAVIETRLQLPLEWSPLLRLTVLLPVGAIVFTGAAAFLDRQLVGDFLDFVRAGFDRKWKRTETP